MKAAENLNSEFVVKFVGNPNIMFLGDLHLCYNISVLIHETFELGISTEFEEFAYEPNFYAKNEFAQIFNA